MNPRKISEAEYVCEDCGRHGYVEEKFKKNKKTGETELAMWTRVWKERE
jgi:hypothetical protein